MRNKEQQAHLASTGSVHVGKDIRWMVLPFPNVCGMRAALAELTVEHHSTVKAMCRVILKML